MFHICAISVSTFPDQWLNPGVQKVSGYYTSHVFSQNWRLFVPCPILNTTLEANYFFNGDSTGWVRPMAEANKAHARWRVTHHAELALSESNLLYWMDSDIQSQNLPLNISWSNEQNAIYRGCLSWSMVKNFIHGTCTYLYEAELDSANVRCTFENVIDGTIGVAHLPKVIW